MDESAALNDCDVYLASDSHDEPQFESRTRLPHNLESRSSSDYRPLEPNKNTIRLLELVAGAESSPLQAITWHVSLDHHNLPGYVALSYEWGIKADLMEITLDGGKLQIKRNLATALSRFRSKTKNVVLWVDAICIDQNNIPERSDQVRKMADIYRKAKLVIVWVGPSSEDSALAVSCIHIGATAAYKKERLRFSAKDIIAIESFFQRGYWTRAWIVQEIRFATRVIVCCGEDSLRWEEVVSFVVGFRNQIVLLKLTSDLEDMAEILGESLHGLTEALPNPRYRTPHKMLQLFRGRAATDPRDCVFAFAAFIPALKSPEFIDYSQSLQDIYQKVVQVSIEQTECLDIIGYSSSDEPSAGKPSWVPDWSTQPPEFAPEDGSGYKASLNRAAEVKIHGEILTTKGFVIGSVQHVGKFCPDVNFAVSELWPLIECFYEWQELLHSSFDNEECFQDSYVRLCSDFKGEFSMLRKNVGIKVKRVWLFGNLLRASETLMPGHPLSAHLIKYKYKAFGKICTPPVEPPLEKAAIRSVLRCSLLRQLIISDEKHIGLAFNRSKKGDLICILFGCSLPILLRPREKGFSCIGFAKMDGFLNGEGMAGLASGRYKVRDFDIR